MSISLKIFLVSILLIATIQLNSCDMPTNHSPSYPRSSSDYYD